MQYNDTSTEKSGILQECESVLFADDYGRIAGNASLLATFTRYANMAANRVSAILLRTDNSWEFSDINNTDLDIGYTPLVSGQYDYSLAVSHIKILRLRVKDTNGEYITLDPVSRRELSDSQLSATGTPTMYDKIGSSFFLTPTPDYSNSSNGIEMQYQRTLKHFLTTDTTKEPGFAEHFHRLIPLWMCYDYALSKSLPIAKGLRQEIAVMEEELEQHNSMRDHDQPQNLRIAREDYGAYGSLVGSPKSFDYL